MIFVFRDSYVLYIYIYEHYMFISHIRIMAMVHYDKTAHHFNHFTMRKTRPRYDSKRILTPSTLLCSFSNTMVNVRTYSPLPSYGLNSTIRVPLQQWLWHSITHEDWYAIKQRNQKKKLKILEFWLHARSRAWLLGRTQLECFNLTVFTL